jgi:hypothetical protein
MTIKESETLPPKSNAQGLLVVVFGVVAILSLLAFFASSKKNLVTSKQVFGNSQDRELKLKAKACADPFQIIRDSRERVKASLKSPSSAKFPGTALEPYKDTLATSSSDCTWSVSSYLDSENGFGASLRSIWKVEAKLKYFDKNDQPVWDFTKVKIDGL